VTQLRHRMLEELERRNYSGGISAKAGLLRHRNKNSTISTDSPEKCSQGSDLPDRILGSGVKAYLFTFG
jgi:hypothetical protein